MCRSAVHVIIRSAENDQRSKVLIFATNVGFSDNFLADLIDDSTSPLGDCGESTTAFKEALYSIWCGVNILGDSALNRLGDTSAFVNKAGQLLLTRRGKTRMDGVGIVFEFYTAPL